MAVDPVDDPSLKAAAPFIVPLTLLLPVAIT